MGIPFPIVTRRRLRWLVQGTSIWNSFIDAFPLYEMNDDYSLTNIITENDELSACWFQAIYNTSSSFSTEIDASVSQLYRVDMQVTCDVCSVVRCSQSESWWNRWLEAAVDHVAATLTVDNARHARTVVPRYVWTAVITGTLKCHRWSLYHCRVQRSADQRRFTSWLTNMYTKKQKLNSFIKLSLPQLLVGYNII